MSWKQPMNARELFREQGPLLVLIGFIFVVFFGQQGPLGILWEPMAMAVPGDVVASWDRLRAGAAGPGDWWSFATLVTCTLMHGDFEHVAFNMLFLWIFGALIVELIGWKWMLGLFFLTGLAGSVTHVALNADEFVPVLGASGAVYGFEGVYLGLATRWRLPDPHVWPMARPIPPSQLALLAVLGMGLDYFAFFSGTESNTAYGAHAGGFTMGLLIAALALPKPRLAE